MIRPASAARVNAVSYSLKSSNKAKCPSNRTTQISTQINGPNLASPKHYRLSVTACNARPLVTRSQTYTQKLSPHNPPVHLISRRRYPKKGDRDSERNTLAPEKMPAIKTVVGAFASLRSSKTDPSEIYCRNLRGAHLGTHLSKVFYNHPFHICIAHYQRRFDAGWLFRQQRTGYTEMDKMTAKLSALRNRRTLNMSEFRRGQRQIAFNTDALLS